MGELIWGGSTTSNERGLAMASHLTALIFPIIGPLIIYVFKKDDSRFVAYHAMQATVFQVVAWLLAGVTCGVGLITLLLPIIWAIKAYNGEWVGYPLIEGAGKS